MGHKVVVIIGLVFAVVAIVGAAVSVSGLRKGWWKKEFLGVDFKAGFLGFTDDCDFGDSCDLIFRDDPIKGGGKGALAAAAIAVFLFLVGTILGIAFLFKRFGNHIGMGAAAMTFMGAFFITAAWAIMIGVWVNWWSDSRANRPSLDGDYALALGIVSTVCGVVAGGCFAYAA